MLRNMARKWLGFLALPVLITGLISISYAQLSSSISETWCSSSGRLQDDNNFEIISRSLNPIDAQTSVKMAFSFLTADILPPFVLLSTNLAKQEGHFQLGVREDRSLFFESAAQGEASPLVMELGTLDLTRRDQRVDLEIENGSTVRANINGLQTSSIKYGALNLTIDTATLEVANLFRQSSRASEFCLSTSETSHRTKTMRVLFSMSIYGGLLIFAGLCFQALLKRSMSNTKIFKGGFKVSRHFLQKKWGPWFLLFCASLLVAFPLSKDDSYSSDLTFAIPMSSTVSDARISPRVQQLLKRNRDDLQVKVLTRIVDLTGTDQVQGFQILSSRNQSKQIIADVEFKNEGVGLRSLVMTINIASDLSSFNYRGATFRVNVPEGDGPIETVFTSNQKIDVVRDGSNFFTYSFSKDITFLEEVIQYSDLGTESSAQLLLRSKVSATTFLLVLVKYLTAAILTLIAISEISKRVRKKLFNREPTDVIQKLTRFTLVSSITVTGLTWFFYFLNPDTSSYYARNGFQYSSFAQFSDFNELSKIVTHPFPYSGLNSNYPPFALWMFRQVQNIFTQEALFLLFMLSLIPGVLTAQILLAERKKMTTFIGIAALTVGCYPILFAFDRGNTDMVIPLVMFVVLLNITTEKRHFAAFLLGLMIAFKIYPIVFLLLFFRRRSAIKNIATSVITAVSVTVFSSALLPERGLSEINFFLKGAQNQQDILKTQPFLSGFNSSLGAWWHSLTYILQGDKGLSPDTYRLFQMADTSILVLLLSIIVIWALLKPRALSITYLIALQFALLAIDLSADYRLGLFVPLFVLLALDFDKSIISSATLLWSLFITGFFLSSHPLNFAVNTPLSYGHLLNAPLLLMSTITLIWLNRTCNSHVRIELQTVLSD
jgi:hypothetical protein